MNQRQAAAFAGVSERTVRRWMGHGRLLFLREPNGRVVIDRDSLELWLAAHPVRPLPVDPEMYALRTVAEVLEPLDASARDRVLEWAQARF